MITDYNSFWQDPTAAFPEVKNQRLDAAFFPVQINERMRMADFKEREAHSKGEDLFNDASNIYTVLLHYYQNYIGDGFIDIAGTKPVKDAFEALEAAVSNIDQIRKVKAGEADYLRIDMKSFLKDYHGADSQDYKIDYNIYRFACVLDEFHTIVNPPKNAFVQVTAYKAFLEAAVHSEKNIILNCVDVYAFAALKAKYLAGNAKKAKDANDMYAQLIKNIIKATEAAIALIDVSIPIIQACY